VLSYLSMRAAILALKEGASPPDHPSFREILISAPTRHIWQPRGSQNVGIVARALHRIDPIVTTARAKKTEYPL